MPCGVSRNQFLQEIEEAARWAVKVVITTANEVGLDLGDRSGGYFCLLEEGYDDLAIPPVLIGAITNGKDDKYITLCQEKVRRLFSKHLEEKHLLSSQSRDESEEQYGGAVCAEISRAFIFGFSGFPEAVDEATMLLTAAKVGCISLDEAKKLASISDNSFFLENNWDLGE